MSSPRPPTSLFVELIFLLIVIFSRTNKAFLKLSIYAARTTLPSSSVYDRLKKKKKAWAIKLEGILRVAVEIKEVGYLCMKSWHSQQSTNMSKGLH